MNKLSIGTRIYNHGDMANPSHFGTVTRNERGHYWIMPDPDADYRHGEYAIPEVMLSETFLGHGGTRIVTEAEYNRWRDERINAYRAKIGAA